MDLTFCGLLITYYQLSIIDAQPSQPILQAMLVNYPLFQVMERSLNECRKAREVFHPIKLSNERIVAHFQNGDNNSMSLIDCAGSRRLFQFLVLFLS